MFALRRSLSTAALLLTSLFTIASTIDSAAGASAPRVVSPTVSFTGTGVLSGSIMLNLQTNNLTLNTYNYVTVKVTCLGTHTSSSECGTTAAYPGGLTPSLSTGASNFSNAGGVWSETLTPYIYYLASGIRNDSYLVYGLTNGQQYSVTMQIQNQPSTLTAAQTFTVGTGGTSNVSMTQVGPSVNRGVNSYMCYYQCFYGGNTAPSGSQVTVKWTPPTSSSFSYYSGNVTTSSLVAYQATGYAVVVLPSTFVASNTSANAMVNSRAYPLFLDSTVPAANLAQGQYSMAPTQLESDGCNSGDSTGFYNGQYATGYQMAYYVDSLATTQATLNGCHFARDEKYVAIVTPSYMPSSFVNEFSSVSSSKAPSSWDVTQKLFPVSTVNSPYGNGQTAPYSSVFLPAGVSPALAADGTSGNLSPELGTVSNVTAVPASNTDSNQKGTLLVSWKAPTSDTYFSGLTYTVDNAGSGYNSVMYQIGGLGLSLPNPVSSRSYQATSPTGYRVTAFRQDASAWFNWLGWFGTGAAGTTASCTATAPATSCVISGLATWSKYVVTVQAYAAMANGWVDTVANNLAMGTGSTIWPQAPSKPLNITASNPTSSSTVLSWNTPASVGGPAGVVISKYTAAMVPQSVPVMNLGPNQVSNTPLTYGTNPNTSTLLLDALPGSSNYVGAFGTNCAADQWVGNRQNLYYLNNGKACYTIFNAKGVVYQYPLFSSLVTAGVIDLTKYQPGGFLWVHREKWGWLMEYSLSRVSGNSSGLAQGNQLVYAPFVSTSSTLNTNTGIVPGGIDFSKARIIETTDASNYGPTNSLTDAHMLNATTIIGLLGSAPTTGQNNPVSNFYSYTFGASSVTKSASPVYSIGCVAIPSADCTDYATLKIQTGPISQFTMNPVSGNIYIYPVGSSNGGDLFLTEAQTYRATYNSVSGTWGSLAPITIGGSSGYQCWWFCGGNMGTNPVPQYSSVESFNFNDVGQLFLPNGAASTLYSESAAGFDLVPGSTLPLQTYDWWWTPNWVGNSGFYGGYAVRTPGGQLFSIGGRWTGDPLTPSTWGNYSMTLNVMLDSQSHGCVTSGATTCTINGTVQGAAYAITVYATNKEPGGLTKDGPAGDFVNVIAGLPNSPVYAGATLGAPSRSGVAATVNFTPSLIAGGGADTSITKYTCALYNSSGNVVQSVDVTPPGNVTSTTPLSCDFSNLGATSYTVAITATNSNGTSFPTTAPQLVVATPPAPQSVSYDTTQSPPVLSWGTVGTGTNTVTLYSNAPYPVSSPPATPVTGASCTVSGTTSQCSPTGLAPSTTYYALVCTTNSMTYQANGTTGALPVVSPATTPSNCTVQSFTTGALPKPSAPVLTVMPGGGKLNISWTPGATNGAVITGYTVTESPNDGTGCDNLDANATSCSITGLVNGTTYTVTIQVNYTANGVAGTETVTASKTGVPFVPPTPLSAPTATAGNGMATISWSALNAPAGVTVNSYTVTSNPDGLTCTVDAPATTCDITGLVNATSYTFTVTANYTNSNVSPASTDDTDDSAASAAVTPQAVAPDAPTNVVASGDNKFASVMWDAPANTGGAEITTYTVTAYDANGNVAATCTSDTTSCDVTGLSGAATYTFTVTATNYAGTSPESAPSDPVTLPASAPDAPTNLQITATAGITTASWTAPINNGGAAITTYTVTAYDANGNVAATCTATAPATTCDLSGIADGSTYTFNVVATNSSGDSDALTATWKAGQPESPTGVTATAGNGSATVSWTAPANDGGSPITGYTVTAYDANGNVAGTCTSTTTTSCVVTGLSNGSTYTFTVVAANVLDSSNPSDASAPLTLPATAPSAPTGVTATAGNGSATVSWTAPATNGGSAITGYTATAYDGNGNVVATCTSTTTSCVISGLTNGSAYTFSVVATNAVGNSPASDPSSTVNLPAVAPSAPTGVTATAGNTTATVTWTAPSNTGGAAITGYTVTAYDGFGNAVATCTSTTTSCVITGLTNGLAYTFSVVATNSAGNSPASSASSTVNLPITAPDAPTNVVALAGDGSATVSWTAPVNDGGAPIDGYIVTAYDANGNSAGTCTAVAPATTCMVTGLTNGSSYTFSVVATDNVGNSASSTPSSSVTPAAGPSAPDRVQVTPGNKTATVNWQAPTTGPAPMRYTVTVNPSGKSCTISLVLRPNAPLSCTFTGLTNGVNYGFTVTGFSTSGASAADTVYAILAPGPTKPSTPRGITFHGTTRGVTTVTWKVSGSNGGSPITRYVVNVTGPRFARSCSVNVALNPNAPLSCTVTGLKPRINYTYTVVAVNSVGANKPRLARRAIDVVVRIATFARAKTTMWSGLYRQAYITAFYIKKFKYTKVVITGYANLGGPRSGTLAYTQARALTVARYLNKVLASMNVKGVTVTAVGNGTRLVGRASKLNRSVTASLSYN